MPLTDESKKENAGNLKRGPNSLSLILRDMIAEQGPLSIATYMEMALYHPRYGYYMQRHPFGSEGDFVTAPEISQMFGEMIGVWCLLQWERLGRPRRLHLIECGAGRGTLMKDLLRSTAHVPDFQSALRVFIVEISPSLRAFQQDHLANSSKTLGSPIQWYSSLDELMVLKEEGGVDNELATLVIANELFDAFPIHQYQWAKGKWHERSLIPTSFLHKDGQSSVVGDDPQTLAGSTLPHPSAEFSLILSPPLEEFNAPAGSFEGAILEVAPLSHRFMKNIADLISSKGAALLIDYGYETNEYKDSLQAVKSHQRHEVFDAPGEADITYHVNFNSLMGLASSHHLETSLSSQAAFLGAMGIEARAQMLFKNADDLQKQEILTAFKRLTDPEEMGALFKVLECFPEEK